MMDVSQSKPFTEHRLLNERCSELLSIRIGKTTHEKIRTLAETTATSPHQIVRQLLAEGVEPPPPPAPLTPQQEAYQAFSNPSIKAAIKSLAQGLETGKIAVNTTEIITHFLTFCPTS
ncbi:hypothetical protein [Runella zeae]|uniref:hypothetical protein n=1 Tax=Runella zeae TaxID=94255 RepID=UPI0003FEBA9C|nr:hypothetical protein [Runella zeae]